VGDGPERRRLERLIVELGVDNSVSLIGADDPILFLRGGDVYVSTSRSEGFSRALLEALAVGMPIVATAVGGVLELPRETVRTVPVGDADATADEIAGLLEGGESGVREGAAGRAVYARKYTLERCHSAYRDLYSAWIR
jgi:glycosyltransferase involved in cell wall biosynthesis